MTRKFITYLEYLISIAHSLFIVGFPISYFRLGEPLADIGFQILIWPGLVFDGVREDISTSIYYALIALIPLFGLIRGWRKGEKKWLHFYTLTIILASLLFSLWFFYALASL